MKSKSEMTAQCGWKVFGGKERYCVHFPGHTGPHMDFIDASQAKPETDCGCTDSESCIPHARRNLGKLFETSQTVDEVEL